MIETAHGPLRLPAYFPDATRAVVRSVDSRDLEACGVQGVVVNAFHLSAHPGAGLLKRAGGVHAFMGWHHPVASDSGGFQLMSMIRENPRYGTVSARGIHFVDADGTRERTLFTPERSIRLQFDLGADLAVVIASAPEGHDKPYKYPGMFAAADVVLLNKADVAPVFDFDLDFFRRGVQMVNPDAPLFVVSCKSGAGMDDWVAWLVARLTLTR